MTGPASAEEAAQAARLEAGRLLFARECTFLRGAVREDDLPDYQLPEVAFAGRSNVGKSSLINAVTGRKTLARTSNTPGRTQEVNFFDLDGRLTMVDLPGYGYAAAPRQKVAAWTHLIERYLQGRPNLRRVLLLIDGRHGPKKTDLTVMSMLDEAAVSYQVVLTKCDKPKAGELKKVEDGIRALQAKHVACHPDILRSSSVDRSGIEDVRAAIADLVA
jgi:GTP-binding protein